MTSGSSNRMESAILRDDVAELESLLDEAVQKASELVPGAPQAVATGVFTFWALKAKSYKTAIYLIENRGADVNFHKTLSWNDRKDCPSLLHVALDISAFDVIRVLIDRGADMTATDKDGNTPLHIAAQRRMPWDIIGLMLDKGAHIYAGNDFGVTPWHLLTDEPHKKEAFDRLLDEREKKRREERETAARELEANERAGFASRHDHLKKKRPGPPFRKKP